VDVIFGISSENKNKNDSFEIYLSAKNVSLKSKIENEYGDIVKTFATAKAKYTAISAKSEYTQAEVIDLLNTFAGVYEKMLSM